VDYTKPWLSISEQLDRLASRGADIGDRGRAAHLLRTIGYYRLTGYLYSFRESELVVDDGGRTRVRVLSAYRPGTTIEDAAKYIDFDRKLRLLVVEGVERIEIALRTQLGHTIGRVSAFAHEHPEIFLPAFVSARAHDETGEPIASLHEDWLRRVNERRDGSDEAFVTHFREKYDDRMPIWALTELLEIGHLSRLYQGLRRDPAIEVAAVFQVPTKKLMESWIATVNYVRNIAAHHARLFNRKLVTAPKRPRADAVPLLAHLTRDDAPKQFGVYSALAVMAYLLGSIHPEGDWARRVADLLRSFPVHQHLDIGSMGIAEGWLDEELWRA